jgi:hypothetical protein
VKDGAEKFNLTLSTGNSNTFLNATRRLINQQKTDQIKQNFLDLE